MTDQPRAESSDELTTFVYSPARVRTILARWEAWLAYAENPSTARQQIEQERPGPTPNTPKLTPKHNYRTDTMGGICVVADIRRAAAESLIGLSLEWYCVNARFQGWTLAQFAGRMPHLPRDDIYAAYKSATERMARYLGWVEPPPSPEED